MGELASNQGVIQQLQQKIAQLEIEQLNKAQPESSGKKKAMISKTGSKNNSHQSGGRRSVTGPAKLSTPMKEPRKSVKVSTPVTPVNRKERQGTPRSTTPKKPNQVVIKDLPADFNKTKLALFAHIKILWGLITRRPIPKAPDASVLKEFYSRFTDSQQIENAVNNNHSANIVPLGEIQTLNDTRADRIKVGPGIVHIEESFIHYAQSCLARMGLRVWCPNLEEATDSLLNSACRIAAIVTFRQVASAGAYNFMNVNLKHINNFTVLGSCYNHFVHHVMAERFRKEQGESGSFDRQEQRKAIQKARERLRLARYKFAVEHNFPQRYQKILEDLHSHSDDEYIPGHKAYAVKTLPFRSKTANDFFRRLDHVMESTFAIQNKRIQSRRRLLPKTPRPSYFPQPPRKMPLDFFDPEWFNNLQPSLKDVTANIKQVAFLPNPANALQGTRHKHERLSDKNFSAIYWDKVTKKYNLDHLVEDDSDESDAEDEEKDDSSFAGTEIDLDDTDGEDDADEEYDEANFFKEDIEDEYEDEDEDEDGGAYEGNSKMVIDEDGVAVKDSLYENEWL